MTDVVVVGAGPNGLTAAVTMARAGCSVVVLEAADVAGGGCRSEELTLPGFVHDVCSAIHPLGVSSPALAALPLGDHGLEWVHPEAPAAHPLPDGRAAVLERSLDATAAGLGRSGLGRSGLGGAGLGGAGLDSDGRAWRDLVGPFVEHWDDLTASILGPLLRVPRHPLLLTRFGLKAVWPATALARRRFEGEPARALFAGLAAHAILDLGAPLTSSFGLTFA
ncbi:MAG TPA: NAD(P)/FAD-dependent oxidoreductase, partial [Acidimicrobiales bacterium]|nr:NAD(P)/FAD-dependent oxidoreductase [Acidimicrobiales bacterium]